MKEPDEAVARSGHGHRLNGVSQGLHLPKGFRHVTGDVWAFLDS